nr:hypothetical protein [Tanacetum cinerariifolium]
MDEALDPHAQRDILHICPRVLGQSFDEPPFEEEILAFIHFLGHKLTNKEIRNSNAYKEYYAIATGAAPPKPKASVRKTRSSSDTSITPPTIAASPRLTSSQKGKQAAKASKAKSLSALSEITFSQLGKSGVEELVPIPSECEVTSEDKSKCDMPIQDQSSSVFTAFSNPLFKDNDDLNSSDDKSPSEEDVPIEESKVYSNPLFDDDEINSDELESDVESNFVEFLSNHDALIDSSQKIDYLKEFSGELAHINPEITEADDDFEKEIRLIENLLYDKL